MSGFLSLVAGVAVLVIMSLTAVDVLSRQLFGGSVPGAVEYGELLLVALVFLGIAQAQRTRAHVAMVIVTDRVRPRLAAALRTFGYSLALLVVVWMMWETTASAWNSWATGEYRFGLRRVTIWPARALIPLGLFFLSYEMIKGIVRDARTWFGSTAADEATL